MRLNKTDGAREAARLDRNLTLEIVRVTERAAVAAAGWRGKGDEQAADAAAVDAMHAEMGRVHMNGRIVIGEGDELIPDLVIQSDGAAPSANGDAQVLTLAADPDAADGKSKIYRYDRAGLMLALKSAGGRGR